MSRFGSSSDFSIRYIFKSLGLSESDVTIVQIGDNPSRIGGAEIKRDSGTGFYVAEHRAREKSRISVRWSMLTS